MKQIAVITGASSGIGREFAVQVARKYEFDEIWLVARREDRLRSLAEEINSGKNFDCSRAIIMDVSGKEGTRTFGTYLAEEDKKLRAVKSGIEIGLLINNAGFGTYGPFADTSLNRQLDMIELNCVTVTGICGAALPYLKKGSVIINTASLAAFMPLGNFAVYAASKSYVLSFSVALAAELKDRGIKVCALCPGSVSSEFADVASNGARKEVKGGFPPQKVVSHCRPKWMCSALLTRLAGRYTVARFTYKHNKRPRTPDTDIKRRSEEFSPEDFR